MYAVYDNDRQEFVAFHEEKEVVTSYLINIVKNHQDEEVPLSICKLKNKKAKRIENFEGLYLVRYNDTYVQSDWVEYIGICSDDLVADDKFVKDILLRMLECGRVTDKKEIKTIVRAIKIIDRLLEDSKTYTPTLKELKIMESDYSPYINGKYFQVR